MKTFLCFDCESAGLTGRTFAVGFVVMDEDGNELDHGFRSRGLGYQVQCSAEDRAWLEANVPKELLEFDLHSSGSPFDLTVWFKNVLEKHPDAVLVVDCGYPVEMQFLAECGVTRYPIHEVATALLLCGKDPTGTYPRLQTELPVHHPERDARQSARLFVECLNEIGAMA